MASARMALAMSRTLGAGDVTAFVWALVIYWSIPSCGASRTVMKL
jgi:hypothetical protein